MTNLVIFGYFQGLGTSLEILEETSIFIKMFMVKNFENEKTAKTDHFHPFLVIFAGFKPVWNKLQTG